MGFPAVRRGAKGAQAERHDQSARPTPQRDSAPRALLHCSPSNDIKVMNASS